MQAYLAASEARRKKRRHDGGGGAERSNGTNNDDETTEHNNQQLITYRPVDIASFFQQLLASPMPDDAEARSVGDGTQVRSLFS